MTVSVARARFVALALAALGAFAILYARRPVRRPTLRVRSLADAQAIFAAPIISRNATLDELDRSICGSSPCRFLVAGRLREQETAALQRLAQVATLAQRTERTLVLPPVGSHFGLCEEEALPFDTFYSLADYETAYGVRAIAWHTYLDYVRQRQQLEEETPSLVVSLLPPTEKAAASGFSAPHRPHAELCLDRFDIRMPRAVDYTARVSTTSPTRISRAERLALGTRIVQELKQPERAAVSTLIVSWSLIINIFDTPTVVLPYAAWIEALADELAGRLRPYAALHWRMEAVEPGAGTTWLEHVPNFASCARDAVAQLQRLGDGITNVLFMTDYPLEGIDRPHSESFASAIRHHPEAKTYVQAAQLGIRTLLTSFGRIDLDKLSYTPAPARRMVHRARSAAAFNLTTIEEQGLSARLPGVPPDSPLVPIRDIAPSLLGIVAKLVAMRADRYISGEPRVCARKSSYAQRIVSGRAQRRRDGIGGDIRTLVDYFGPSKRPQHRYLTNPSRSPEDALRRRRL